MYSEGCVGLGQCAPLGLTSNAGSRTCDRMPCRNWRKRDAESPVVPESFYCGVTLFLLMFHWQSAMELHSMPALWC